MENKVLITGGAGFIGSNLIEYLLTNTSLSIAILDNFLSGRKEYLDQIFKKNTNLDRNRITLITGDIRRFEAVKEAAAGVNAVVHLAAFPGVFSSLKEPREAFEVNVGGTFNVLEVCRQLDIERFVYASSNAAVGQQTPPVNEEKAPLPVSPYGASKLAGEALCSAYYHSYGIKAISLRFANAYGIYSIHKTSVIPTFIRNAKEGKPLIIYGACDQTRAFVHVHDICNAIYLAMQYVPANFQKPESLVFQISSSREIKILDLANHIVSLAKQDGLAPPPIQFNGVRKGEVRNVYSSIEKAKDRLNFYPAYSFEEGIQHTWQHYYIT